MQTKDDKSKRPRTKPVSVEEIAETALACIDAEGLEGLTMRKLARAIGVEPMTLYRYLPNKEAILAVVADRLWQELSPFVPEVDGWAGQVRLMWLQMYELMLRHPHAVPLIARAGTYSATATEGTARMLGILKDSGFSQELASEFMHVVGALVVGFAYAQLWLRLNAQGQRPDSPAGEMGPLPPALLEWARGVGPSAPWQFAAALDMVMASFAERLTGKRADEGTGPMTAPSSNVAL